MQKLQTLLLLLQSLLVERLVEHVHLLDALLLQYFLFVLIFFEFVRFGAFHVFVNLLCLTYMYNKIFLSQLSGILLAKFFQKWQVFARAFTKKQKMKIFFSQWKHEISELFSDSHYLFRVCLSFGLLALFVFFSKEVSFQNDIAFAATSVDDTFFHIIPRMDLSWIFVAFEIILIGLAFLYGIFIEPKRLDFFFLAFAIFVLIRAFCISLTHIGIPVDYIQPTMGTGDFFFHNDLFFSGHTGGPFLVALLLWEKKPWRYTLLALSLVMAFTVLAMRLHYSIDIVGAYFITFGIFKITEYIADPVRPYNQKIRNFFSQKK